MQQLVKNLAKEVQLSLQQKNYKLHEYLLQKFVCKRNKNNLAKLKNRSWKWALSMVFFYYSYKKNSSFSFYSDQLKCGLPKK